MGRSSRMLIFIAAVLSVSEAVSDHGRPYVVCPGHTG